MDVVEQLLRARQDFERGDWVAALDTWSAVDPSTLSAEDLVSAAVAAHLLGRRDEAVAHYQRAFDLREAAGDVPGAARCAFHVAMILQTTRGVSSATGWLARAERLVESLPEDHLERGYVAFARMFANLFTGRIADAMACAVAATDAGRREGDGDLLATGLCAQGRLMIYSGRVSDGLALLDEAMVEATTRGVQPVMLGHLYCTAIEGCQEVSDLRRVAEWTAVLDAWCVAQPGLVTFMGQRSLHRGQVLRAKGEWDEALEEFDAASARYRSTGLVDAVGQVAAEQGDVLRLRGDLEGADASYQVASEHGYDPQPGLALLWVARGQIRPAMAAIRRVLAESPTAVARGRVLPGAVDVLLAGGDVDAARAASRELMSLADAFGTESLVTQAAIAAGAVEVAAGDHAAALPYLRKARQLSAQLQIPYAAGLAAALTGRALAGLGDEQSARRELGAARAVFVRLGAKPDVDAVDRLLSPSTRPKGLSDREVEVLRLVAAGRSNAQIATELVLSDRTVARHVSNIFTKLDVSSRTAAAAFAFDHGLV